MTFILPLSSIALVRRKEQVVPFKKPVSFSQVAAQTRWTLESFFPVVNPRNKLFFMLQHTIFLQQTILLTNKYFVNVLTTEENDGAKLVLST